MATDLTGLKVQNTYNALLKIGDNSDLTGIAKVVSDGVGHQTVLYLSTSQVGIGGVPDAGVGLHVHGNVKVGNIETTGYLRAPATFTIDPAAHGNDTGVVVIAGDLRVDGTTTTINSTVVSVDDKNILLGDGATADSDNNGAGITVLRPSLGSTNSFIQWNETTDQWDFSHSLNLSLNTTTDLSEGTNLYYTDTRFDNRLSTKTTDNLTEGLSNLYFTTARARASFSGGTGVTITSGSIAIGQNVGTTSNVTFGSVTGKIYSTNKTSTPDKIGDVKIARVHESGNTAISSFDNLDTFILSNTATTLSTGTKPTGASSALGIISLQTLSGNYYTQLALDTEQNQLWIRSANNALNYGSWATFINASNYVGVFDDHYLRSDQADTMNGNLTVVGNVQATTARLTTEGQANLTSTAHGFQIGDGTTTDQLLIDNNTMMVRNNGAGADMYLNSYGGDVFVGVQVANNDIYVGSSLNKVLHSGNWSTYVTGFLTSESDTLSTVTARGNDTADTLIVTAVDTGNPSAAANSIRVSGYGILGNRGTFYVTNGGGGVQIGNGSIHNSNPAALFESSFISLYRDLYVTGSQIITETITTNGIYYPLTLAVTDTAANVVNQVAGDGVGIQFKLAQNTGGSFLGGSIAAVRENASDDDSSTSLEFYTSNNDETLDKKLTILSNGNVTASTFVGALTGNATTATKWATARTITLGGDLTGNVSIDGSANVTLSAQVVDDSHNHDGRYYTETEVDNLFSGFDLQDVTDNGASTTNALSINSDTFTEFRSATDNVDVGLRFSSMTAGTQYGNLKFNHVNTASYGSLASFVIDSSESTLTILADGKLMYAEGIYSKPATGTGAGTRKDANWDSAYSFTSTFDITDYTDNKYVRADVSDTKNGDLSIVGGHLYMNNNNIYNVNHITINDAGVGEGIEWLNGNGWKIYESPNTLTNASGNLQFVTGSTRRMTIDTSGNLEVTNQIVAKSLNTNNSVDLLMGYYDVGVATTDYGTFIVNNHADVIIGSNLRIDSNHDVVSNVTHSSIAGSGIVFGGNNHVNGISSISFYALGSGGTIANTVTAGENANMVLTSSGLGIGTSPPVRKLDVNSGASSDIVRFGNDSGNYTFGNTTNLASLDLAGTSHYRIRQGSSTPFYIGTNGYTGINDTTPSHTLDVGGSIGMVYNDWFYIHNGSTYYNAFGTTNAGSYTSVGDAFAILSASGGWHTQFIIDNDTDNCGIGTKSPQEALHVGNGVGIFNVSDNWQQSTYRTSLFRGGNFESSISNQTNTIKIYPATSSRAVGNYWGGISFMHLDPENSSWGTSYTGAQMWIGGRIVDQPGQERSAFVIATNNSTTAGTHPTEKFTVLPNGNVGIGTTSPSAKLDVAAAGDGIRIRRSNGYPSIKAGTENSGHLILDSNGGSLYLNNYVSNNVLLATGGGNVGIGTTSPYTNLYIQGAAPYITIANTTEDDGGIFFTDYQAGANPLSSNSQAAAIKFNSSDNILRFCNNDVNNTVFYLHSGGDAYFLNNVLVTGYIRTGLGSAAAPAVQVGDTDTGFYDSGANTIGVANSGVQKFNFDANGTFRAAGDVVAYYSFSDRRLKTNIKPLKNSLEKIKALQGVSYEWKDGERKGKTEVGLIAQEVEKIVPEVVREQKRLGDDKNYKTVDYEKMVGVLIEAIKEQQQQIDELKSKLDGITK